MNQQRAGILFAPASALVVVFPRAGHAGGTASNAFYQKHPDLPDISLVIEFSESGKERQLECPDEM